MLDPMTDEELKAKLENLRSAIGAAIDAVHAQTPVSIHEVGYVFADIMQGAITAHWLHTGQLSRPADTLPQPSTEPTG